MPRSPAPRPSRLSRDARRLVALSESLALSGCRLEDAYWENLLNTHINKLLLGRKNTAIETALEHLVAQNISAYEILVEHAENLSESTSLAVLDAPYDVLLFSAPVVAWTRYQLPGGDISAAAGRVIDQQLREHILAEGAQLALIPQLVCFDQMPQSFQETRIWTERLGQAALGIKTEPCGINEAPDSEGMLADARFLVGVIAVPAGASLFRWQSDPPVAALTREKCFEQWVQGISDTFGSLFTGCRVEYLQPDAFYINSREADRRIRPLALKAAVTWLQTAAHLSGGEIRAIIAGCGESTIEEYRVGFTTTHNNDVIYGCIWPILSKEEALSDSVENGQADIPDEISALLKELGVVDIRRLPGLHPAEYCDDCGAPHFPNAQGEMLHPELPEEVDLDPVHFH